MALVPKTGRPSLSSGTPDPSHSITGRLAGEDLKAGDMCYLHTNGTVMKASGAADNAAAKSRGIAAGDAQAGEAVTLYRGVNFRYGSGLIPGASFYLSATAGALDDAPTTGGTVEVAYAVDDTRIFVHASP